MKAKRRKVIVLVLAIAILLVLGTVCYTQCALFNETKIVKPSPVDTSILKPLADYPNYDLEELKVRLGRLEGQEGVKDFSQSEWIDTDGREWASSYNLRNAQVQIIVFGNYKSASKYDSWGGASFVGVSPEIETVSGDINTTLYPIFQYRDSEAPWSYSGFNLLYTSVRIGNMVVDISESNDDVTGMGTDTNKALAQIVEVLLPDAKTP